MAACQQQRMRWQCSMCAQQKQEATLMWLGQLSA
jgi:hypothetical protein